ncbi:uncharacterized protein LOC144590079 [Rhinoraja longicauda]
MPTSGAPAAAACSPAPDRGAWVGPPRIAGLGSAHRGPYTVRRGLERGSFNSLSAGEDIRGRGKTSWPSITVRRLFAVNRERKDKVTRMKATSGTPGTSGRLDRM